MVVGRTLPSYFRILSKWKEYLGAGQPNITYAFIPSYKTSFPVWPHCFCHHPMITLCDHPITNLFLGYYKTFLTVSLSYANISSPQSPQMVPLNDLLPRSQPLDSFLTHLCWAFVLLVTVLQFSLDKLTLLHHIWDC